MAFSPLSLLLLRACSHRNPVLSSRFPCPIFNTRLLSSLLQSDTQNPKYSDAKTSLSARMSFVFDQIDALEREKSEKDETLQRIRAWRDKKHKSEGRDSEHGSALAGSEDLEQREKKEKNLFEMKKEIEVVHPWPEWIELMEQLVRQNYFDHRRKCEDSMLQDFEGVDTAPFVEEGFDFTRDWTTVRTASLNFGRDRHDILRSLSRKDIQILVGHGCPSLDTKVVFSAKVLRKHTHIDEGDVCSSCSLRSSCNKAFLLTRKEDEARTLDVVRVLLTFGFDPINGSVENKPLTKMKSVKTVVRKLLHEVVKLSSVPIDPNLPPPIIKKPPPKVKQPPPPPKKRVGRDDIEMKKGDWLCPKCDFMNFAKNTVCLQCDAKRPQRQLLPGEWECPDCNFLNYRRNMVCFHCEHKRPPDEFMENQAYEKPNGPRTRLEKKAARVGGVSDAWNFDFDDNESDGADVAAFEFADPPKMSQELPLDSQTYRSGDSSGFERDSYRATRSHKFNERERTREPDQRNGSTIQAGFDDFDDEEEDDVNSYVIDTSNKEYSKPSRNFSEFEELSGSEDTYESVRHGKSSQSMQKRLPDNDLDFDSDEEVSNHPTWKSSHVADSRPRTRRGGSGPYRGLSFDSDGGLTSDSDVEVGLNSNVDDEDQRYTNKWDDGRKTISRKKGQWSGVSDYEDEMSLASESDDEKDLQSLRSKARGNKSGPTFRNRDWSDSAENGRLRSSGKMGGQRHSFNNVDHDRSSGSSCRNERGSRGEGYGGRRANERGGNFRGSDRRGLEESDYRPRGKSNDFNERDRRGRGFGGREESDYKPRGKSNDFNERDRRGRGFGGREESDYRPRGKSNDFNERDRRGRGFGGSGYSSQRTNEGASRGFDRRSHGEGFGNNPRGRSNDFKERLERERGFDDDRPHRRINTR